MERREAPALSLAEWLVLCAICEQTTHRFAIAALLGPGGSLGQVWRVPKATVHRAAERLEKLSLIRMVGERRSPHGPPLWLLAATPAGRDASTQWLNTPVAHTRDIRSELMVKLALLDRAGGDPRPLLLAQQMQLAPIAAALSERAHSASGLERTIALWRHEAMSATMRFLAGLSGVAS
jgi:DNA-binding MarR family transcriptional regulator